MCVCGQDGTGSPVQGRGVSVGPARRDTRAWGSGVRAGRTRLGAATLTAPRCRVQNDVGALASVLGEDQAGWPQRQEAEAGPGRLSAPAGILFPSPRSCCSPAWRICSSQSRPSSSRAASGLATPLPAAGETEARAVEWGGPVPLRTDLTLRGRTRLSQDECPMLPPEAAGLRRWRTLRHPRPQPPARPLTEPNRAARPAGTRERAGLECPRQAALAGRGAVRRRPAAREPVTALGCPLSWEWL